MHLIVKLSLVIHIKYQNSSDWYDKMGASFSGTLQKSKLRPDQAIRVSW